MLIKPIDNNQIWVIVQLEGELLNQGTARETANLPAKQEDIIEFLKFHPETKILDVQANDLFFTDIMNEIGINILNLLSNDCNLSEMNQFLCAVSQMDDRTFECMAHKLVNKKAKKGKLKTCDMMKVVKKWRKRTLKDWKIYQAYNPNATLHNFLLYSSYITQKLANELVSSYGNVSELVNVIQLEQNTGSTYDPRNNQPNKWYFTFILADREKMLWRYCGYCFKGDIFSIHDIYNKFK